MTHEEIHIGHVYGMKVGKNTVAVRIDTADGVGWKATYVKSGKPVAITSAAKLLYEVVTMETAGKPSKAKMQVFENEPPAEAPKVSAKEAAVPAEAPGIEAVLTSTVAKANEESWNNIPDHGNHDGSAKLHTKNKPAAEPSAKKLSCLDAAAQVLANAGKTMTTAEMIEAMAKQGLWSSPTGATPAATLYSAILRETATKGDIARFVKTERGKFTLRASK